MKSNNNLVDISRQVRINILDALFSAQSGHPGPSLSVVEIVTTLFFKEMNLGEIYASQEGEYEDPLIGLSLNPNYMKDECNHDVLILSKGHAAATVYASLAEMNLITRDDLKTLREMGSKLQGHLVRGTLPLVSASTGSLGQGLSIGIGRAIGSKLKKDNRKIFVIVGDGESQEGQIWEAIMSAPKFKLNNLVVIVDYNKFQNDGAVNDTMPLEPLFDKWKSFGWHTKEIDGHNIDDLIQAFKDADDEKNKPSCIIAHTVKGKGVSFMENNMVWHSKALSENEYNTAINELRTDIL
jgi:transketolase